MRLLADLKLLLYIADTDNLNRPNIYNCYNKYK